VNFEVLTTVVIWSFGVWHSAVVNRYKICVHLMMEEFLWIDGGCASPVCQVCDIASQ
jgi:hypothetical protein